MGPLVVFALLGGYGVGAWKFWNGFKRTSFNQDLGNRVAMSALWPFLMYNKSYRKNFQKALKGD